MNTQAKEASSLEQKVWITRLDQIVQTVEARGEEGQLHVVSNRKTLLGPVQKINWIHHQLPSSLVKTHTERQSNAKSC